MSRQLHSQHQFVRTMYFRTALEQGVSKSVAPKAEYVPAYVFEPEELVTPIGSDGACVREKLLKRR